MARPKDYGILANHFHCYYELFYLRQGNCRFYVNDNLVDVGVGDILIIPPKEVHYNRYMTPTVRTVTYFRAQDVLENGVECVPNLKEHFFQMQTVHVPSSHRPMVESLLDTMLREETINDENTGHMLQLLLKQFFLICNRYCTFHQNPVGVFAGGAEDIIAATHYISDHYNQPITLDDVAANVNLSPTYLSKKFHQTIGKTLREYLISERLKHAALELISTKHSITEIAINSGFSDANYFKDVFKKVFGSSPRDYRKRRAEVYRSEKLIKYSNDNPNQVNTEALEALSSNSKA